MAVVTLRLFASARLAAGVGRDQVDGGTVAEILDIAVSRFGPGFAEVLAGCRVWRNGEPAERGDVVADGDEIAVLPPVSGGATTAVDAARAAPGAGVGAGVGA